MKKTLLFFVSICIGFGLTAQNNKLTLTSVNGLNVDTVLKRHLEGPGVKITDGQFNMSTGNISGNNSNFIGRFIKQPNANFPFQKGLYMKTGDNSYYDGNNTFTSLNLTDLLAPGQRLGYGPTDSRGGGGSALDFNFVALSDTFAFNYVFASSEYTSYTCSNYNDIFAFFLEGWDYVTLTPTTRNVAVVPNTITANNPTGIPVAINTINGGCTNSGATVYYDGTYSAYFTQSYNNSYPSDFGGLNGSTVALTAESRILACQTYKMHLAISNVNDHTLNSAVFLEEGSFYSPTVEIVQEYDNNNTGGDTLIQNCRECDLTFKLPIAPETPISVGVSVGGGAVLNQDFELELPDGTLLNPTNNNFSIQGSLEESLHMKILPSAAFSPGQVKEVKVYFVTTPCLALADLAPNDPTLRLYDTLTFYLRGNDSVKIQQGITSGACDTLKSMNVNLLRGNPTNFTWTPSTGILTPNSMSPSTAITQSGTYKLVASDPWNCMKDSTEIEVNIVEKPDFTVSYNPKKGCVPLDVILQTQYTPSYATPEWTVFREQDPENLWLSSGNALFSAALADTGYYSVKLLLESAPGCADSVLLSNAIHVSDYPEADFTFSPSEPGNGEVIYFTNASAGDNITDYAWNFGDGHSSRLENPEHAYHLQESDIKTVILTVTNADGCSDNVHYSIPVEDNFAVFIPGSFTPNEDGNNDVFLPKVKDVTNYRLEIYARNGEMVFFSTDPNEPWDGKFKGKVVPEGIYVYKIYYSRIGNPDILMGKTGSITIIR